MANTRAQTDFCGVYRMLDLQTSGAPVGGNAEGTQLQNAERVCLARGKLAWHAQTS